MTDSFCIYVLGTRDARIPDYSCLQKRSQIGEVEDDERFRHHRHYYYYIIVCEYISNNPWFVTRFIIQLSAVEVSMGYAIHDKDTLTPLSVSFDIDPRASFIYPLDL